MIKTVRDEARAIEKWESTNGEKESEKCNLDTLDCSAFQQHKLSSTLYNVITLSLPSNIMRMSKCRDKLKTTP